MTLAPSEKILLIGDARHEVRAALADVLPDAVVTAVGTVFDGIAELTDDEAKPGPERFTTVLAAAEPIERRPEAAVRTLRNLAGDIRLVLFGHSTLELLSRKMLKFGCDDYLVTPASGDELRHVFATPNQRPVAGPAPVAAAGEAAEPAPPSPADLVLAESMVSAGGDLDHAAVGGVLFDALLQQPHNPIAWTLRLISGRLGGGVELLYRPSGDPLPVPPDGRDAFSHPMPATDGSPGGTLHAVVRRPEDDAAASAAEAAARGVLQSLAPLLGKAAALQARHAALQKMAITDELTGLYNARYFRHFLQRIVERARQMHFPVTLLLFDIDDFKRYNDQFGHQVGDEILKQTAAMMKRCTREHDLVARIGGDEFAVVFWDKEGPRQPREPRPGHISRPPQSPEQIFERFKRMIQSDQFTALGHTGQGKLGVSAGLAVYPYDAHDVTTLIAATDNALMQGSKKHGKNRLSLVGNGGHGGNGGNGGHGSRAPGGGH